jgi:pimeloyl-ACP methyl ester carboxylesterase
MVPDWNRDGRIDEDDSGRATTSTPWRFWINNDDDSDADAEGTGGDDLPGQLDEDRSDNKVNGIRDLVDFFPLYVDLQDVLNVYPSSEYRYRLKQADSALAVMETDMVPASANEYLRDLMETEKYKESALTLIDGNNGLVLTDAFLASIQNEGKGVLLLEGRKETERPLALEIVKKSNGMVVISHAMPLFLSNVESMFRHKNLRDVAVGGDHGGADDRPNVTNHPDSMNENSYLVWVHGYNNDGEAARAAFSEVFKRLFWSGYKGKFYPVSWNGDPPALFVKHYHNAVINAFATADDLATFVNGLQGNVCVAGHSLGNMVVGLAINDHGLRCGKYFAIDAAVALEAYNGGELPKDSMTAIGNDHDDTPWSNYAGEYKTLWASEWYRQFDGTPDHRNELSWRDRLVNVGATAGPEVYNFYSRTEEVLREYPGNSYVKGFGTYAWVKQEKFKGTEYWLGGVGGASSDFCGWGFNLDDTDENGDGLYYNKDAFLFKTMKTTWELGDIGSFDLIHHPFFTKNPVELFEDAGSDFVDANVGDQPVIREEWNVLGDVKVRDWLLAKAFPALTLPMGANPNNAEGWRRNNFDLSAGSVFKTDSDRWPRTELTGEIRTPVWYHSDYKDITYQHVYKFYDKIVELSEN